MHETIYYGVEFKNDDENHTKSELLHKNSILK